MDCGVVVVSSVATVEIMATNDAEKLAATKRRYYLKHRDEIRAKQRVRGKAYYYRHHERIKAKSCIKAKLYYKLQRLEVIDKLSGGTNICANCGHSDIDVLFVDHVDNNGSQHRKGMRKNGVAIFGWLIKNKYPSGFQVLCANCNWKKEIIRRRGY